MNITVEETIYLHGLGEMIGHQPLVDVDQLVLLKTPDDGQFATESPRLIVIGLNDDPRFIQEIVQFASGDHASHLGVASDFWSVDSQQAYADVGQLYAKAELKMAMNRVSVADLCNPSEEEIRTGIVLQFIGEFGIEAFSGRRHVRSIWPIV